MNKTGFSIDNTQNRYFAEDCHSQPLATHEKGRFQSAYALLLLPHFKPACLEHLLPVLDTLFDIGRALSFGIILSLVFIRMLSGKRPSKIIIAITLYVVSLAASTLLNHGEIWGMAVQVCSLLGVCLLIDIMVQTSPRMCLKTMLPLLEILVYLNLLTILLYPNGMFWMVNALGKLRSWRCWLLGYDNGHIVTLLPALAVTVLLPIMEHGAFRWNLRNLCLIAAVYATVLITWPAATLVALAIIAAFLLFPAIFKATAVFNMRNYLIGCVAFFIVIVLLRRQDLFKFIIEDVLHKDLTFTTRTGIWDRSIAYSLQKPFLGYGVRPEKLVIWMLGIGSSHNTFLWDFFCGGVILVVLRLTIIVMSSCNLTRYIQSPAAQFLSVVLLGLMIFWQVESYRSGQFFMLFVLAYNIERFLPTTEPMDRK